MAKPNAKVVRELVELFKLIADICDGAADQDDLEEQIRGEYERLLAIPAIKDFYGELIDQRHAEVYGE